ncbi:MAG TPA: phosphatidate cytidylyltransferase [Puia sp.]|uniref:phosphatidate cytidylyltransferase n=1 Tax=Puia sp. TaxID=2045100 RepID=UPI002C5C35E8|nr:phosphatidate cytidylyltransferase [Puia sp.]HVU97087.1 phosphatidate cytidylyltransferase [Puia sp.]
MNIRLPWGFCRGGLKAVMNNLTQRTITGGILGLLITAAVCWNAYSFIFLMLVIDLLSLGEFYRLFHNAGLSPRKSSGLILSTSTLLTCFLVMSRICGPKILIINIPAAFGIFISELFRQGKNPFHNLAFTFLGILCITIPLCFFIGIAFFPAESGIYHSRIVVGYFFLLWASDSGAYFIGKAFGTHALFRRISPKKTWEGSLGGAVCALFVAYILSRYAAIPDATAWMIMALIIVVMGTFGDLIKSMMKRSLNLKDSGTILPGHGGMLDRFDTLLGSAPFVFCYLIL